MIVAFPGHTKMAPLARSLADSNYTKKVKINNFPVKFSQTLYKVCFLN